MAQALQGMSDAFSNAGWPRASAALDNLASQWGNQGYSTAQPQWGNTVQQQMPWSTVGVQPATPTAPAVNTQRPAPPPPQPQAPQPTAANNFNNLGPKAWTDLIGGNPQAAQADAHQLWSAVLNPAAWGR
jgi:hypothetical protein